VGVRSRGRVLRGGRRIRDLPVALVEDLIEERGRDRWGRRQSLGVARLAFRHRTVAAFCA